MSTYVAYIYAYTSRTREQQMVSLRRTVSTGSQPESPDSYIYIRGCGQHTLAIGQVSLKGRG